MFDILFFIIYFLILPRILHIMQQESYQNDGMFRWIVKNPKQAFGKGFKQLLITTIAMLSGMVLMVALAKFTSLLDDANSYYILIPFFVTFFAFFFINLSDFFVEHKERKNAKKPLKYTARAKRLLFFNFLTVAILEVFILDTIDPKGELSATYLPLVYSFLVFTLPINMIISNWLVSPIETAIANRYKQKAYNILNKKEYENLIKIGITGSYGKTSTKYILKMILEEKFNVLATPGSYNTSMGNVRVIREQLKPEHEVLFLRWGQERNVIFKISANL